jgi:hypothetical protein
MSLIKVWRKYWAQLDWVEELFYLIILATEACTIYPWQLLIFKLTGHKEISLVGLCVLLWVPYLIASLVKHTELTPDRKQALTAGLTLLSAFVAIRFQIYAGRPFWDVNWIAEMVDRLFAMFSLLPPELLTIVLVFIGWWRGIVASRQEYDNQRTWFHFRLGVVILLVYFVVTIFDRDGRVDLSLVIFAYFFFGLMSIALARIQELGGIHSSTLGSKQWIAVLIASTLGNLGLTLLASLLFSRQVLRTVLSGFQPLWRSLMQVAWFMLSIIFYLAWPLIDWLTLWIKQIVSEGTFVGISPLMSPLVNPLEAVETEEAVNAMPYCRALTIITIVVGGLLLVTGAIRRLSQQQAEREDLERESLLSSANLMDDLKNSLRQGLDRLRAFAGQFESQHRRSAASIRKIYASMVDLATEAGYPRRPAETPYEYRTALYEAFAGGQDAVDTITEAYVRVHYGEVPGTREEMDRIVHCWQEVQTLVVTKPKQDET